MLRTILDWALGLLFLIVIGSAIGTGIMVIDLIREKVRKDRARKNFWPRVHEAIAHHDKQV